jgi:hypothetical protein
MVDSTQEKAISSPLLETKLSYPDHAQVCYPVRR